MAPEHPLTNRLTRRELLAFMGAAGIGAIVACDDDGEPQAPTSTAAADGAASATAPAAAAATTEPGALACVVSPEMTEGPYFVDELLERSDIRSDPGSGAVKEGVPLALTLTIYDVDGDACTPLGGVLVDIWHCDAEGLYSDVAQNNTVGQKFLRGYQITDDGGAVSFATIYPGWYMGRAVHIHLKVRTDPQAQQGLEFTSQLFFDDALTDQVHVQAPYNSRGARDVLNASDNIYQGGGDQMLLSLTPEGDGYATAVSIGVQMS
jgi:protocatechuate 3,4-dioxygenase beta subunit